MSNICSTITTGVDLENSMLATFFNNTTFTGIPTFPGLAKFDSKEIKFILEVPLNPRLVIFFTNK